MTCALRLRSVLFVGGAMVAIALSPGAGVASADPITDALVNTTCGYGQITAALNAEAPDLATMLNHRPQMASGLQQFLALPIDQRQQRIAQEQSANPQMTQLIASAIGPQGMQEITQVANTCQNY